MSIVIADIAGEHKTLLALIEKLPKEEPIVLVGDLVDRGKRSNLVIDWAMKTPNVRTLRGNHEDMLLDFFGRGCKDPKHQKYQNGIWEWNGGDKTLRAYGPKGIPEEHLAWLESLPLTIDEDGFFISHAPWNQALSLESACNIDDLFLRDFNIVWNRERPEPIEGKIQVFGHNSHWGLREFKDKDGKLFAICLDDSAKKKLTAFNTKTQEIIQQPYIR